MAEGENVITCTHEGAEHVWQPGGGCPDAIPAGLWAVRPAPVAAEGTDELRDTAPAQPGNDQLYLDSIRTEGGETVITAHGAEQTLALMALSMRTFFEANSGDDTNYVQSGVVHKGKTWNFVVYPAGKPTPHDLRRRAEAERDVLLAKVQAVEALAESFPARVGTDEILRALGGESRG